MARKLYVDGLRLIAEQGHRYGSRYQSALSQNLTADQYNALLDWLICTATLLVKLGKNIITPTP